MGIRAGPASLALAKVHAHLALVGTLARGGSLVQSAQCFVSGLPQ